MIKKINKLFKKISGEPKDVGFTESIKIVPFIMLWIISIGLVLYGFRENNPVISLLGLPFAWQNGWGMSINRTIKSYRKKNEDTK